MGKYNFDEVIDRHGTACNKWEYNIPEGVLPMWVADMDFSGQLLRFAEQGRNRLVIPV